MKKKKKLLTIVASVLGIIILLIGAFFLGRISIKDKSLEPKNNLSDNSQEIQRLKTELNSVKNQLNQSNSNQKDRLKSKFSDIENKVKILVNQDKSTIQKLEQEIKEIKEKFENDNPNPDPSNRKEGKFEHKRVVKKGNTNYFIFNDIGEDVNSLDWRIIRVNENHPQIKQLLNEGKLQTGKLFIIRYGKPDEEKMSFFLIFDENNRELEIVEA